MPAMTSDANYSCFLGADGWEHPQWFSRFYPDDLPVEWRLAFYSQFFNCVSLSYAAWSGVPRDELKRWLTDMASGFKLVLAAPRLDFTDDDKARLDILRPHIGIICTEDGKTLSTPWSGAGKQIRLTGEVDLKSLSKKLQKASYSHPLYLIHSDANIGELEKLKTLLGLLSLA